MTQTFPHGATNDPMIYGFRMTAGTAWAVFLLMALAAIRRGDVAAHRAFMLRALAIGYGAGTTVITFGLWYGLTGIDSAQANALAQAAGWGLNLALAEWVIGRRPVAKGVPA